MSAATHPPRETIAQLAAFQPYFRPGFITWLEANWHIYRKFEWMALKQVAKGRAHFSARTIVEEIRQNTRLAARGTDEEFKVNGNWVPDLGRLFTVCYPEYASLWEYRRADWRAFLTAVQNNNQKGK